MLHSTLPTCKQQRLYPVFCFTEVTHTLDLSR
jgi:hypothetical protein